MMTGLGQVGQDTANKVESKPEVTLEEMWHMMHAQQGQIEAQRGMIEALQREIQGLKAHTRARGDKSALQDERRVRTTH